MLNFASIAYVHGYDVSAMDDAVTPGCEDLEGGESIKDRFVLIRDIVNEYICTHG